MHLLFCSICHGLSTVLSACPRLAVCLSKTGRSAHLPAAKNRTIPELRETGLCSPTSILSTSWGTLCLPLSLGQINCSLKTLASFLLVVIAWLLLASGPYTCPLLGLAMTWSTYAAKAQFSYPGPQQPCCSQALVPPDKQENTLRTSTTASEDFLPTCHFPEGDRKHTHWDFFFLGG